MPRNNSVRVLKVYYSERGSAAEAVKTSVARSLGNCVSRLNGGKNTMSWRDTARRAAMTREYPGESVHMPLLPRRAT